MIPYNTITATKIRALYQRTKGRDLLDLWLLTNTVSLNADLVCHAFSTYRPEGFTAKKAIKNLEKKLDDKLFLTDIENLISIGIDDYNAEVAVKQVIDLYLINL